MGHETVPMPVPRSKATPWLALAAICVGYFMDILDTTVVNVALPSLGRDLSGCRRPGSVLRWRRGRC